MEHLLLPSPVCISSNCNRHYFINASFSIGVSFFELYYFVLNNKVGFTAVLCKSDLFEGRGPKPLRNTVYLIPCSEQLLCAELLMCASACVVYSKRAPVSLGNLLATAGRFIYLLFVLTIALHL